MNNIFYIENKELELLITKETSKFITDIDLIDLYYTESDNTGNKIIDKVKSYIKKILDMLKDFTNKMKDKVKRMKVKHDLKADIKAFKKDYPASEYNKNMSFFNVWEYENILKKYVNDVGRLVRIWNTNYPKKNMTAKRTEELLKRYDEISNMHEREISELKNITVKVSDALKWLENNYNNNYGTYYKNIDNYYNILKDYNDQVDKIRLKLEDYKDLTGWGKGNSKLAIELSKTGVYIKKNYDWLLAYSVSTASRLLMLRNYVKGVSTIAKQKPNDFDSKLGRAVDLNRTYKNTPNNPYRKANKSLRKLAISTNVAGNIARLNSMREKRMSI